MTPARTYLARESIIRGNVATVALAMDCGSSSGSVRMMLLFQLFNCIMTLIKPGNVEVGSCIRPEKPTTMPRRKTLHSAFGSLDID
jgi:hypothetical protein